MSRKVFISFLGASNYKECDYIKDGKSYGRVRFIQEATLNYLNIREKWSKNDAIYILLTNESEKRNWADNGQRHPITKEIIEQEGLSTRLSKLHLNTPIYPINELPDGNNEQEIWEIFEKLFGLIQEGDELYFDLTHGYRYLPMLMLVLGNYSKFLKHISVQSITYGNYEISKGGQEPGLIVDFLPLSQLQDWTTAAANYINFGNVDQLVNLSNAKLNPILREAKGSNINANLLKKFISSLQEMINERQMCRGRSIISSESLKKARESAMTISDSLIPPLTPIIEQIKDSISNFSDSEDIKNGIFAAQWCVEKSLFQQAITILNETIISLITSSLGLDFKNLNDREIVTMGFRVKDIPQEKWELKISNIVNEEEREKEKQRRQGIISSFMLKPYYDDLTIMYNSLADMRNDINHCGMRSNPMSSNKIKSSIEAYLNKVMVYINDDIFDSCQKSEPQTKIFINLSNHPSELWSKEQKEAAREYGEIIDLPFPEVRPDADKDIIEALVKEYLAQVLEISQGKTATVHIMGEMTLTFALVKRLQAMGIKCVASTSERIVSMESDGTKVVKFDFCRFRDYE